MIRLFYGKKGSGKTKRMIETANECVVSGKGSVVYIDDDSSRMYDLKHRIRFIDVSGYGVNNAMMFTGFIAGIISQDYDIDYIFIDGLNYIVHEEQCKELFEYLEQISQKFDVKFYISMNGDENNIPEYLVKYTNV